MDPVQDRPSYLEIELDLRLELREEGGFTALLETGLAGAESVPITSELSSPLKLEVQLGELGVEEVGSLLHFRGGGGRRSFLTPGKGRRNGIGIHRESNGEW
jgi:hypothetical protein